MKVTQWLQVALFTTASFFSFSAFSSTTASTFDHREVNADNFVAVAAPFGDNKYQLLVIEQISNQRPCWRESNENPVLIEPLLLNFDFTGICGRSTDSNGYSIRMEGQDLGLDYMLRLVKRGGELVLVGTPVRERNAPEIEIGRTRGISNGFQKIFLDSGWRLTRRTYAGRVLGHLYLTSDTTSPVTSKPRPTSRPQPLPPASAREPLPPPAQRELIFTRPEGETNVPREWSEDDSDTLPPVPERNIPVFGN
ncbi:MAG: DUF3747 domain-containing protein [Coleofasciculaceae cyanobacterium]